MQINVEKDLKQENRNAKIWTILFRIWIVRINYYRKKLNIINRNKIKCIINIRLKFKKCKRKMKNGKWNILNYCKM